MTGVPDARVVFARGGVVVTRLVYIPPIWACAGFHQERHS